MKNIAFVCTENTCRSPMAECIFKHICYNEGIKNVKVSSYGLLASDGSNMNDFAKTMLINHKIRYKTHKSKKLTDKALKKQDYVFVMTNVHKSILKKYSNVYTIAEFIDGIEIPDPYSYGYEEYEAVYKIIYTSAKKIFEKLKNLNFFN